MKPNTICYPSEGRTIVLNLDCFGIFFRLSVYDTVMANNFNRLSNFGIKESCTEAELRICKDLYLNFVGDILIGLLYKNCGCRSLMSLVVHRLNPL